MAILRLAVIGLFSMCYVVCQNDDPTAWILDIVASENQTSTSNNSVGECTTDDGKPGMCVKKAKCNKPNKTVIDPTTTFILRERDCHYLQECCALDQVINSKVKVPQYVPPNICGISNPGALVFREKDEVYNYADFADFPWMVALLKRGKDGAWSSSDYIGGGSIIHQSVVITAAHKVDEYDANEIKCRAGEWDTQTEKEVLPFQERNVKKIVLHDEYLRLHAYNNVALLILEQPFELAPHVGIACLGRLMPQPGTKCFSMGWGADFKNKKKYAVVLKKIQMPLVGDQQCENNLRNTRLGSTYNLHNSLTCAGGEEGVDTCVGDGGSSLVCPIDNPGKESLRYAVFGMVAYGIECGVKNVPGVYVNVPEMYQWVVRQMKTEGFPKSQFDY